VLEALAFPLLLALAFRLEGRLPLPPLGVWLNLLWFVYPTFRTPLPWP